MDFETIHAILGLFAIAFVLIVAFYTVRGWLKVFGAAFGLMMMWTK